MQLDVVNGATLNHFLLNLCRNHSCTEQMCRHGEDTLHVAIMASDHWHNSQAEH